MFKQGPSALSRLLLYSALALFLMVADARFQITGALRQVLAAVLYPVQWVMLQPVQFIAQGSGYFQSLQTARKQMALMSQRSMQTEQLMQENARLRQLLDLRARLETPAQAAQVLYDTADPYTRRVVVDQGQVAGVELGSPVLDEKGVLGQVTRVHPFVSEVTLLIDRDQAIPVLNLRTGVRGVAYGDPVAGHGGGMELRFMPSSADIQEGDLLTTSGVDGLYPPGLPVAKVVRVERRADSAFARIYCVPIAEVQGARHVMLLKPMAEPLSKLPEPVSLPPGKKVNSK